MACHLIAYFILNTNQRDGKRATITVCASAAVAAFPLSLSIRPFSSFLASQATITYSTAVADQRMDMGQGLCTLLVCLWCMIYGVYMDCLAPWQPEHTHSQSVIDWGHRKVHNFVNEILIIFLSWISSTVLALPPSTVPIAVLGIMGLYVVVGGHFDAVTRVSSPHINHHHQFIDMTLFMSVILKIYYLETLQT